MTSAEINYDDIEAAYGRRILAYHESIRARTPTDAETRALDISDRHPLIEVRRTSRTTSTPVSAFILIGRAALRSRLPNPGMTEHQPSPHPAAKDLAQEKPPPMHAKLAGYPWLPRIIDKARASHAGTLGTYYRYPCPIDTACLDLLGIDADTFREIANQAATIRPSYTTSPAWAPA